MLTGWDFLWWVLGFIGNVTLLFVLIRKKRNIAYPVFTFMVGQHALQSILLSSVRAYAGRHPYFYFYWGFEIFDDAVRVALLFELCRQIAKHAEVESRLVPYQTLAATLPIAAFIGYKASTDAPKWVSIMAIRISMFSNVLTGAMVFVLFAMVFWFGLRLRSHAAAITYGFLAYFMLKTCVTAAVLFQFSLWPFLDLCLKPLYILLQISWIFLLWDDEPKRLLSGHWEQLLRLQKILDSMPPPKKALSQSSTKLCTPTPVGKTRRVEEWQNEESLQLTN
jgi:hypothetical protein